MNAIAATTAGPVTPASAKPTKVEPTPGHDARREPRTKGNDFGPALNKAQRAIRVDDREASSPADPAPADAETSPSPQGAVAVLGASDMPGPQLMTSTIKTSADITDTAEIADTDAGRSALADDEVIEAGEVVDDREPQTAAVGPTTTESATVVRPASPALDVLQHDVVATKTADDSESTTVADESLDQPHDAPVDGTALLGRYGDHAGLQNTVTGDGPKPAEPATSDIETPRSIEAQPPTADPETTATVTAPAKQDNSGDSTEVSDPIQASAPSVEDMPDAQRPATGNGNADTPEATTDQSSLPNAVPADPDMASPEGEVSTERSARADRPAIVSEVAAPNGGSVVHRDPTVRGIDAISSPEQLTAAAPMDEAVETELWGQVQRALARVRNNLDGQEVRIRLRPAELGELLVQVQTRGDQLSVRLVASSAAAQQTLINDRQRLAAELTEAGFDRGFVDISRDDERAGHRQADHRHGGGGQANSHREGNGARREIDADRMPISEHRSNNVRHSHAARTGPRAGSTVSLTL